MLVVNTIKHSTVIVVRIKILKNRRKCTDHSYSDKIFPIRPRLIFFPVLEFACQCKISNHWDKLIDTRYTLFECMKGKTGFFILVKRTKRSRRMGGKTKILLHCWSKLRAYWAKCPSSYNVKKMPWQELYIWDNIACTRVNNLMQQPYRVSGLFNFFF